MHWRMDMPEVIQYHPVLEMGRYVPVYHTKTGLIPGLHTGTYHYILYPVTLMAIYRCFPFRALSTNDITINRLYNMK
jgi:hypothetical protein